MKYLKSINETITIDQIDQTIKWIKEKVDYDNMVGIFEEIKQNFDDVGDFKWSNEIVAIEYSYLVGKRNMKNSFKILSEYKNTKDEENSINLFLKRIESATKISIKVKMSFKLYDTSIPVGTYQKLLKDIFIDGNLGTIVSSEDIEMKISCQSFKWGDLVKLSDFQHFLKDSNSPFVQTYYTIGMSFSKDLPNNIFSDDDGTDPIEKLPQSIIKDFTQFVNKVKLTRADRKELVDIIKRGYGEG